MPDRFNVGTTPRFDRLAKSLRRQHPEFILRLQEAVANLAEDPTIAPARIRSGSSSIGDMVKASGACG